jgi:hypothetical protein
MTTTQEARRLRQELAAQERGRGKRYDRALLERVVVFAKQRRTEGRSWAAIATELGARYETIRRWCEGRPAPRSTALALRPVEIVAERVTTPLSVVSPSGLRVQGATLDEVITILRTVG